MTSSNSTSAETLILLVSTPERPPNPLLKLASLCSYKECYSHSQQNHALAKILRTLMTQVRARMRREKLFSQIKINETVNIYFLRNNFLQKDSFTSKCLQHKYIYIIVLSYVV